MSQITTQESLLKFIKDNLMNGTNLSIRGVARLCGVADKSIINGGSFNSGKLAEKLTTQGFEAGSLLDNGFNSQATWLVIEYFAYESKAKAEGAKQLARTFGRENVDKIFNELAPKAQKYDQLEELGLSDVKFSMSNDIVKLDSGVMVTDSLSIARDFEKQHKNVLRDIGSILSQSQDLEIKGFFNKHFQESEYLDSSNRVQKYYKITREGFSFLVLGFTGEKATKFKIKYIEAFEKMYSELRGYAIAHFLGRTEGKQLVYVISNPVTGLIKVGITDNIKRRVSQLQNASGCELKVIFVTPVADNSRDIEKVIHSRFADFRQYGEWFNVDPDLVVAEIIKQPLTLANMADKANLPVLPELRAKSIMLTGK